MNAIAGKEHAILGPSGWDRWSTCAGSVVLEEGKPNPTSSYAAWGTVAHEIAARCLIEAADAESFLDQVFTTDGHEVIVDMEMADTINTYLGVIQSRVDIEAGDVLYVEQEVPIGHLTGETGAEGTADAVAIVNGGKKLIVIDFKGGAGVMVFAHHEPDDFGTARINGQLGMYALGALEKFGMIYDEIEEVELVISQPRVSEEPSSITIHVNELTEFAEEVKMAAGRVALAQNIAAGKTISNLDFSLELHPSEKACKFCRAKADCPALRSEVRGSLREVSRADPIEFEDLTLPKQASSVVIDAETDTERLASFMRAVPLIEDAIKAVQAEVMRRLCDGQAVPGFKLVEGKKGNRKWREGEFALDPAKPDVKVDIEGALKSRLGVGKAYVKKLISVTEAEKEFKAKPRTWAKLAPLITQAPGKPSVAPESDPRKVLEIGVKPEDFPDLTAGDSVANALLAD